MLQQPTEIKTRSSRYYKAEWHPTGLWSLWKYLLAQDSMLFTLPKHFPTLHGTRLKSMRSRYRGNAQHLDLSWILDFKSHVTFTLLQKCIGWTIQVMKKKSNLLNNEEACLVHSWNTFLNNPSIYFNLYFSLRQSTYQSMLRCRCRHICHF